MRVLTGYKWYRSMSIGRYGEKAMGLQRKGQAVGFERCEAWGVRNYSVEETVWGVGEILGWKFEVEFTA